MKPPGCANSSGRVTAAVSEENVELARGAFGLISIPGEPAAMIAAQRTGVEFNWWAWVACRSATRVRAASASSSRDVEETWEFFRFEGTGYHDLGDRVLILGDVTGRGLLSGADVKAQWALIVELEDSKAARVQGFLDHDEALEAAGLEE